MRRNPLEWVSEAMVSVTAVAVLAMMVHVTADVSLKYVVNSAIPGTLEVTSYYYMVPIVLLPLGFVELTRQSIAVDIFYQLMPDWAKIWMTGLVLLISAVCYGVLASIALPDAIRSFAIREMVMGATLIPIWPARFVLPVGFGFTALVCLMLLVHLIVSQERRLALIGITEIDPERGVD